jgi:hypothetical protein
MNVCVLGREYTDKTTVNALVTPELGWSVRLTNPKWTGIRAQQNYSVTLNMDGNTNRWTSAGWLGLWSNAGEPGVMITNLSTDFMWSFMKRSRVDVYNGDKWMTGLYLDGSFAGMAALIDCQNEHGPARDQQQPKPQQNSKENWS